MQPGRRRTAQLDAEIVQALARKRPRRHHASRQAGADAWDVAMDAVLEQDAERAAQIVAAIRMESQVPAYAAITVDATPEFLHALLEQAPDAVRGRFFAALRSLQTAKPKRDSQKTSLSVGAQLRDALVKDISGIGWDGEEERARAAKVKAALQQAVPRRGGFLVDTEGWTWEDEQFLRDTLDAVADDLGNITSSRGFSLGGTGIGRQIRALREKL